MQNYSVITIPKVIFVSDYSFSSWSLREITKCFKHNFEKHLSKCLVTGFNAVYMLHLIWFMWHLIFYIYIYRHSRVGIVFGDYMFLYGQSRVSIVFADICNHGTYIGLSAHIRSATKWWVWQPDCSTLCLWCVCFCDSEFNVSGWI